MALFFSRYNKEWTREKQTDKIYQLWGGRELSAEVQKAPPCLCHRCLVVAQGRRHFTVVYLYSSLFIQASKRTSGITFLTWSPQNMAVFPSTSATSERSLGQAWFFFCFVLKTHLFCLRTATFQFKAPTPNYRDNCRNARCILHHHHRMPPNAPSINSDELKKKKKKSNAWSIYVHIMVRTEVQVTSREHRRLDLGFPGIGMLRSNWDHSQMTEK